MRGQCTDSGGGGTLFALVNNMKEYNLTHEHYLISSCTSHNLQTGRIGTRRHETEDLKEIWNCISEKECAHLKFRKLEEPVLSRWWLVGACASSFKECRFVWERIRRAIRNSAPSSSACNQIASCTLNLIQKPVIMNDLELMIAFHKSFVFPHFDFLQKGDPKTGGTPSFLGQYCTVRYYLMKASDG